MTNAPLTCTACKAILTDAMFNRSALADCPGCGVALQVEVFPALFRPLAVGRSGEAVVIEGESSCFYHAQKKAVVPCDVCGRFLCGLCDVEFNDQHICPVCLEAGRTKGKMKNLENHRTLYDSTALCLAGLALLMWPLAVVMGPIAIFLAIRYWNKPSSIVRQSKTRAIAAILVGLIDIFVGAFIWYTLVRRG